VDTRTKVEICHTSELEPSDLERLHRWLPNVLGTDDYKWSDFDRRALVRVHGQVVSHVGISQRVITAGGKPVRLGGIGAVATLPSWRGKGFATAAVKAAVAFLCHRQFKYVLLVCTQDVVPFYRDLGWQVVDGPVLFDQPRGKTTWPNLAMIWSCQGEAWPEGTIDLCGLPW
jgi:GNAT superfamily N-acetyltransferase